MTKQSSRVPGNRRFLQLLALLVCAATSPLLLAQDNLYKCVDSTGKVSIQSDPCPSGSTTAWRRPAPSEPAPTASEQAAANAKILRDQQTVRELSEVVDKKLKESTMPASAPTAADVAVAAVPAGASPIAIDPCQVAQAFANSVREKSWLGLTDDQLRRLYGWVGEQCKVKTAIDD